MQDRPNLSVDQEQFIVAVSKGISTAAKKTPVVTLTMTPGSVVMPWLKYTDAVLNIFLAGHCEAALGHAQDFFWAAHSNPVRAVDEGPPSGGHLVAGTREK
mmetsp:Transcript_33034/g.108506  ORF Transcript_33034/g.108506 Transcript_33034/m.108506 type:complete len:101 (+) Transcript_33034:811-1113(+)